MGQQNSYKEKLLSPAGASKTFETVKHKAASKYVPGPPTPHTHHAVPGLPAPTAPHHTPSTPSARPSMHGVGTRQLPVASTSTARDRRALPSAMPWHPSARAPPPLSPPRARAGAHPAAVRFSHASQHLSAVSRPLLATGSRGLSRRGEINGSRGHQTAKAVRPWHHAGRTSWCACGAPATSACGSSSPSG